MTPADRKIRICVVCAGNICRSPIAQVVLERKIAEAGLSDRVSVDSAGTGGWHAGDPADHRALATLRAHGYDGSAHRARRFEASWFDDLDLVLVMDRDNFADIHRLAVDDDARSSVQMLRSYDADALDHGDLDVPDPYYGDDTGFDHVLALVERAATGVVDTLAAEFALIDGGEPGRH